jgi:threonine dehydrogenase-like Zn-dependent dehydrogenase
MEKMLAAVFKGNGVLELEEREIPVIKEPDQVLVKVIACGICGSDLHALHVPPGQDVTPGTIMGHEIYGQVLEIGSAVSGYKAGDYVVVNPNLNCGVCNFCKRGLYNMCKMSSTSSYGQQRDGGFAPYVIIKAGSLVLFPKKVKGMVGAQTEPLACVMSGIKKVSPSPLDNVVIYGAGPIGLLYLRCLIMYGVRNIIMCDTSEYKREYAKKCGANVVVDPATTNMKELLTEQWGELATIVIDAVGASSILNEGAYLLQPGGKYLIFGLNQNASSVVSPAHINMNEIQIMGSFLGRFCYVDAIKMLTFEDFHAELLVSHKFELKDILKAFELAESKKSSRIIIYPNGFDD